MVDAEYPELIRNQWHSSHDYTLRLSDNVDARLSPQQLISLWKQIEQDQRPIDAEELAAMKAQLVELRATRSAPTAREQQPVIGVADVIARHADYVSDFARHCTCGEWSDTSPEAQGSRLAFCAHVLDMLSNAGFALVDRATLDQLRDCYGDEFADGLTMSGEICQDCWEPFADNPLCICRATYEPCPEHGGGHVFTTPREKQAGIHPINCPVPTKEQQP